MNSSLVTIKRSSIIFLAVSIGLVFGSFLIFNYFSFVPIGNFFALLSVICYVLTLLPSITKTIYPKIKCHPCLIWLLKYRRHVGVASFCFGAQHGALIVVERSIDMLDMHTYIQYFHGSIILSIFALLTATSNNESIKWLKRNWKKIHQLTYLIPAVLLWHITDNMRTKTCLTKIGICLTCFVIISLIFKLWKLWLRHRQSTAIVVIPSSKQVYAVPVEPTQINHDKLVLTAINNKK